MEAMFCDREVVLEEKSADGEWSLQIYGPVKYLGPGMGPQPHFYASFMKIRKEKIIAVPFGREAEPAEIKVNWDLPGDICSVLIGEDCYVLFNYGIWRFHSREFFRQEPEPPFNAEEIKSVGEKGRLPE